MERNVENATNRITSHSNATVTVLEMVVRHFLTKTQVCLNMFKFGRTQCPIILYSLLVKNNLNQTYVHVIMVKKSHV